MGEQVHPTLLDITRSFSSNRYSPDVINQVNKAHIGLKNDPVRYQWALQKVARTMGNYALRQADFPTAETPKTYQAAYMAINIAARQLANEGVIINADFGMSVYMDIMPIVLGVGRLTETLLNSKGNNSIDQIRAVAKMALQAEQIRDQGGEFIIFTPTCSHYNTALANEEGSYDRGLLSEIHTPQLHRVLDPIKRISTVLTGADIPVRIVIPQVNPMEDPRVMFAMVPAALWKHINDQEVAAMILQTHRLSDQFNQQAASFLDGQNSYFQPATLADYRTGEQRPTTMDITARLNQLFEDFIQVYTGNSALSWHELSTHDLRRVVNACTEEDRVAEIARLVSDEKGWSEMERVLFGEMFASLSHPGWGTLDDTERFYARESQRRAGRKAFEWRRTFDYEKEISRLLNNPNYLPYVSDKERQNRAIEMIQNVDQLANIGIGGRAIFNTTVYFALGIQMGELVAKGNGMICWPIQEATDRQAFDAMNRAFMLTSGSNLDTIPLIIPNKTRLQPLGIREDVKS